MDMEAQPLLDAFTSTLVGDATGDVVFGSPEGLRQIFRLGSIDEHPVLLVTSGIGLANAASATARALTFVDAPIVIAGGTTGGLARDIAVGDIAAGTSATYSAADATAFGYEPGQIPGMPTDYTSSEQTCAILHDLGGALDHPLHVGRVVSADSFVTQPLADPMRQRFPDAIAADMETCAMAQVAWSCGVDWVSLRAVSDLCGPAAGQDFHMDGAAAARHSAAAIRAFLRLTSEQNTTKALCE